MLIVFFINNKDDLLLYFFIQAFSTLFSHVSLWLFLKDKIIFVLPSKKDIFQHLEPSISYFITKVSTIIYVNGTKTILGLLGSMQAVDFFSNSFTLIMMVSSILSTMNTVMIPRLSNLSSYDKKKFKSLFKVSMNIQLFFTIAFMFGLIVVSPNIVSWFFGPEFSELKIIIPLISPVIIFQNLQAAIGNQFFIPQKKMRRYNFATIGGAIIAIVVSVIFIPKVGVYGAILAITLCYMYICISMIIYLYKRTDIRFEYRKIIGWGICGFLMALIVKQIESILSSAFLNTVIQVILGGVIYLLSTSVLKINLVVNLLKRDKS